MQIDVNFQAACVENLSGRLRHADRRIRYKLDKKEIKNWVKDMINLLPPLKDYTDILEVSIMLVDNNFIKRLNQEYRHQDNFTDVLAFPQMEKKFFNKNRLKNIYLELKKEKKSLHLGDIIISIDEAQRYAKKLNHSLKQEIKILILHGLLHLLGYQDKTSASKKVMMNKSKEILRRLYNYERD